MVPNFTAYVKSPEMALCRIEQADGIPDSLAVALVIADCARLRETGQALANARLIAAAPDLLAACNAFLLVMDGEDDPSDEDIERALIATREAVAKAEGRES
jgi:hypothetical protein